MCGPAVWDSSENINTHSVHKPYFNISKSNKTKHNNNTAVYNMQKRLQTQIRSILVSRITDWKWSYTECCLWSLPYKSVIDTPSCQSLWTYQSVTSTNMKPPWSWHPIKRNNHQNYAIRLCYVCAGLVFEILNILFLTVWPHVAQIAPNQRFSFVLGLCWFVPLKQTLSIFLP